MCIYSISLQSFILSENTISSLTFLLFFCTVHMYAKIEKKILKLTHKHNKKKKVSLSLFTTHRSL